VTTTYKWETLPALTTYLSTELNSLANAGLKLGAAIAAGNEMWAVLELSIAAQGVARSAGAYVGVYVVKSLDGGTTYEFGSDSLTPPASCFAGSFPLDASTSARVVCILVFIPACTHCKLEVVNATGQALAATGNTLKYGFVSEIAE
jgi:hypothetical protein